MGSKYVLGLNLEGSFTFPLTPAFPRGLCISGRSEKQNAQGPAAWKVPLEGLLGAKSTELGVSGGWVGGRLTE